MAMIQTALGAHAPRVLCLAPRQTHPLGLQARDQPGPALGREDPPKPQTANGLENRQGHDGAVNQSSVAASRRAIPLWLSLPVIP